MSGRIPVREVIVVEGRYDKNTLLQIFDAAVVETGGFGINNDAEKLALLRRLAAERGLVVLTDSDAAGFMIRAKLKGASTPRSSSTPTSRMSPAASGASAARRRRASWAWRA